MDLPDGYWIEWSGKYEQLRRAASRTAIIVPIVLFVILGILYLAFASWRVALLIFLNVPVAASGGLITLWLRGLPISMSAIVGMIALFGIAVMNGIVLVNRTRQHHRDSSATEAAKSSALERLRPVLMTAFVAGIGFVPMALQVGVGAEVQRPLATVVIGGLVTSTLLTLVVLPSLYGRLIPASDLPEETDELTFEDE
jgi:cobalt-zinc-cadmium resistance protein CzcA